MWPEHLDGTFSDSLPLLVVSGHTRSSFDHRQSKFERFRAKRILFDCFRKEDPFAHPHTLLIYRKDMLLLRRENFKMIFRLLQRYAGKTVSTPADFSGLKVPTPTIASEKTSFTGL